MAAKPARRGRASRSNSASRESTSQSGIVRVALRSDHITAKANLLAAPNPCRSVCYLSAGCSEASNPQATHHLSPGDEHQWLPFFSGILKPFLAGSSFRLWPCSFCSLFGGARDTTVRGSTLLLGLRGWTLDS